MTTPEEPRLHGAFAEQLRALQASDATEAELAWVGTRLLALQQQYTRDLDTAGFGDAGREAFTDAYCADAPHDPERRSQATVLWHTSVLPENVLGGVIPAPPRDPIVETIRHARHTAVAYSAAREEYAGAWIDEDIPHALRALHHTYDDALVAWGDAIHHAPEHLTLHLPMPEPHPDLSSQDPEERRNQAFNAAREAAEDLEAAGPFDDPDCYVHEAAQVGPTIYALVEEPIDQSLFVCALRGTQWTDIPAPASEHAKAAYEAFTAHDAPTELDAQLRQEATFVYERVAQERDLGEQLAREENALGVRYAVGEAELPVHQRRERDAVEREWAHDEARERVELSEIVEAPQRAEAIRQALTELGHQLAQGDITFDDYEERHGDLTDELKWYDGVTPNEADLAKWQRYVEEDNQRQAHDARLERAAYQAELDSAETRLREGELLPADYDRETTALRPWAEELAHEDNGRLHHQLDAAPGMTRLDVDREPTASQVAAPMQHEHSTEWELDL